MVALSLCGTLAAMGVASYYVASEPSVPVLTRSVYLITSAALFYCALAYQLNRFGAALRRPGGAAPGERSAPPESLLSADMPSVTVLIPSYKEERRVLRMTLLSAALAAYGNRRIVVLLDDPPQSDTIAESRAAVEDVRALLADPVAQLKAEQLAFAARRAAGPFDAALERRRLRQLHAALANWLAQLGRYLAHEITPEFAHVDRFFIDRVVAALSKRYRARGAALSEAGLTPERAAALYADLALAITAEIESFERKRYGNLSHAPNKAMNLNSYLGLMGRRLVAYRERGTLLLREAAEGEVADLDLADSRYVLTLDADSVILPDYIATLAAEAEADPTIGVVQTPYHTFPDSPHPVERIAGATTDIQYLVHQGSSFFGGAFWVGANALLRREALEAIHERATENGKPVEIFIQDATVIEDTGSTIDLLRRGYRVHNHFDALAYSATPADFGSLAIQRQRWSNGGLLILPALLADYLDRRGKLRRLPELALRSHYLLSPLIGNAAILTLMLLSVSEARHLVFTPLAMLPYFWLYAEDLRSRGYRRRDLFGVSALNLMLLPVGLAGVVASALQGLTGRKSAFWRTPKVAGRTAVAPVFILFNFALMALMARYTLEGAIVGDWLGAVLPAANLALYAYGFHVFLGWRNCAVDLASAVAALLSALLRLLGAGLRFGVRLVPRAVAVTLALLVGLTPVNNGTASSQSEATKQITAAHSVLPRSSFKLTTMPSSDISEHPLR